MEFLDEYDGDAEAMRGDDDCREFAYEYDAGKSPVPWRSDSCFLCCRTYVAARRRGLRPFAMSLPSIHHPLIVVVCSEKCARDVFRGWNALAGRTT